MNQIGDDFMPHHAGFPSIPGVKLRFNSGSPAENGNLPVVATPNIIHFIKNLGQPPKCQPTQENKAFFTFFFNHHDPSIDPLIRLYFFGGGWLALGVPSTVWSGKLLSLALMLAVNLWHGEKTFLFFLGVKGGRWFHESSWEPKGTPPMPPPPRNSRPYFSGLWKPIAFP